MKGTTLNFESAAYMRHRIILSTLSNRPIRISNIREHDSAAPGLSPSEISFIRLMDKLTSGSTIEINETGTSLRYKPGMLIGGDRLTHDCHTSRGITYYLEPLLMLAPYAKHPINITLRGATHAPTDASADSVCNVLVPLLRRLTLGSDLSPSVDVRRRSIASVENGGGVGGMLTFRCDVAKRPISPIQLTEAGYVKRIRGVAFANRVSPSLMSGMIDVTRGLMNRFSPDVYLHTDHCNEGGCGVGVGVSLIAETTEGCLLGADWAGGGPGGEADKVAGIAGRILLEEICTGGCVDSGSVCMALLYCALADCDLSCIRVGKLSAAAVEMIRDLERFFGVMFKIEVLGDAVQGDETSEDESESDNESEQTKKGFGILLSSIGVGLSNVARQRF